MATPSTGISLPYAILGVVVTVFLSVGGSYMSLERGAVKRETTIEWLQKENENRKKENSDLKEEVKELRNKQTGDYQEILKALGEIKAELKDKQSRR